MVSLDVLGLRKDWPDASVDVTLHAQAGEILAIAGPSGCGKTTVLRMIAGLVRPDGGGVIVGGRDVTGAEPRDRGVGMVFQDYALFPHLDVQANVAYGLRTGRLGRPETARRVARLLEAVGLAGFERRRPQDLSGGERQRVALARTLAVEPSVILFDEPLSSLDAALRKRLRADIVEEQRRLGFTAVYVTHDLEEAMAIGDALAIMDSGRVLQSASPRDVWSCPSSAAVARFMGSGPCLPVIGLEAGSAPSAVADAAPLVGGAGVGAEDSLVSARTGEGLFSVRAGAADRAAAAKGEAFVFFERSAASPVISNAGRNDAANAEGSFTAMCLRADFAGDAVDCLMESGGHRFTLRFGRDAAPHPGSRAAYRVPSSAPRLLS